LAQLVMGATLSQSPETLAANGRKGRPNHSEEFRLRLAAAACEPGISVSKLAREHGIHRYHHYARFPGKLSTAPVPIP